MPASDTIDFTRIQGRLKQVIDGRDPRSHQLEAAMLFLKELRFALFWDMGTGKTTAILLGLALESPRSELGSTQPGLRTVILCPKNVIHSAWMADAKFFPNLIVQPVHGIGPGKRIDLIKNSTADVFVTTYELFRADQAKYLDAGVQRLVIDESSKIKNHKAKTSQIIHAFGDRIASVWALSGEPAPNCGIEYWSQMRAVCPPLVGASFYRWAYTYFQAIKKEVGREHKEVIVGWRPIPDRWATFVQSLRKHSWALESSDVQDLPEQIDITVPVEMTKKQRNVYVALEEDLVLDVGEDGEISVAAAAKLMKCKQVANGWAYIPETDREAVMYSANKLEAVTDLLDELHAQGEQVVVWAEFRYDIDRIADACFDRWSYRICDGRTKDAAKDIRDFQDHDVDVLICHPASVGHGVTLTAARYAIFNSVSHSSEQHNQAKKRTHRMGQGRKCFYYYMTTTGTVEPTIAQALQEKRSASKAVLNYLKREV